METKYIVYLLVGIVSIVFACSISSFDYYAGGIAENSRFTIGGAFSQESFLLIVLGCFVLGYSVKGLSENKLKQQG